MLDSDTVFRSVGEIIESVTGKYHGFVASTASLGLMHGDLYRELSFLFEDTTTDVALEALDRLDLVLSRQVDPYDCVLPTIQTVSETLREQING